MIRAWLRERRRARARTILLESVRPVAAEFAAAAVKPLRPDVRPFVERELREAAERYVRDHWDPEDLAAARAHAAIIAALFRHQLPRAVALFADAGDAIPRRPENVLLH